MPKRVNCAFCAHCKPARRSDPITKSTLAFTRFGRLAYRGRSVDALVLSRPWPGLGSRPSTPPGAWARALAERLRRVLTDGYPRAAMDREADMRLVGRVLKGDARAEAQLLDALVPHLRAVARAILSNPADVDDAVQVALLRVLEGLPGFRGDASLIRWARRVAAHTCLRQREQNARRLRLVELGADEDATPGPEPDEALGEALPRHVAEYLEQLPAVQREVLVLRHVLDHSVAEVAELVGAPIDTVKSRLLYARRALRSLIRRDEILAPHRGRADA